MEDSIWTTAALKEYIDSHFDRVRAEIDARYIEKNREHDKFEESVKESMVKQNEFRGALSDLGKTMATRNEVDSLEDQYSRRLGRTESIQAKIAGALILISVVIMPGIVLLTFFLTR